MPAPGPEVLHALGGDQLPEAQHRSPHMGVLSQESQADRQAGLGGTGGWPCRSERTAAGNTLGVEAWAPLGSTAILHKSIPLLLVLLLQSRGSWHTLSGSPVSA